MSTRTKDPSRAALFIAETEAGLTHGIIHQLDAHREVRALVLHFWLSHARAGHPLPRWLEPFLATARVAVPLAALQHPIRRPV